MIIDIPNTTISGVSKKLVQIREQGGAFTILDPSTSQIGHKESVADTARLLGVTTRTVYRLVDLVRLPA